MTHATIQYVGFRTGLSATAFRVIWTPIALAFKSRGIATIDLYEVTGAADVAFLSRNVWNARLYLQVFPSGLADSAAFGPVEVIQFGGFAANHLAALETPALEKLSVLLAKSEPAGTDDREVLRRVSEAVPYFAALEGAGATGEQHAACDVRLDATHVCRL